MIVWRGRGFLVIVFLLVGGGIGSFIGSIIHSQDYGIAAGFVLGAVVNWLAGQRFNGPLREAGFGYGRLHTFFWIPMEFWSVPMLALAAFFALGFVR
jgi:hypothetical protein